MAYSLRLERTVDGNMAQDAEMLFHPRRNSGFDWPGGFAGVMQLLQKEVALRSVDHLVRSIGREREKSTYGKRRIALLMRWFTVS
jgi:hypothetical protein